MSRYRLDWIADRFDLMLHGDGAHEIAGVAPLAHAGAAELAFLSSARYLQQLASSSAGVVILRAEHADACNGNALIAADPYVAYAKVATLFARDAAPTPGIHPSAIVAASATVSDSASIGPFCVIDEGAVVAAGAVIGAQGIVGANCHIGEQCTLLPRVTLLEGVQLGQRVRIHPGAVLGADGFGLAFDRDHWVNVPQLGSVRIGDDCEIGANSCIDRGALEDTVLECDVRLDNLVHIAHNVHIGAHTALAGCAAVAGSARIGSYCQIAGGAGILGHITVADRVTITAMSLVTHSIHEPGEYSSGTPLEPNRRWRRNAVRMKHLDDLARRVAKLEKDQTHD